METGTQAPWLALPPHRVAFLVTFVERVVKWIMAWRRWWDVANVTGQI